MAPAVDKVRGNPLESDYDADEAEHAAAVKAAAANPVRRRGTAKARAAAAKDKRAHQKFNWCPPLLNWHSEKLPDYLRDNEFIVGHYRPGHWTYSQILYSIFRIHNETFNIWSHLLGFLFFAALTVATVVYTEKAAAELERQQVERWPMYVFFGGAMTCLLFSAVCHVFGCCAQHVTSIVWRFDYVGITVLIVTSFYPPVYYGFMCTPHWQQFYLWSVSIFGAATVVISLMEVFQSIAFRHVRAIVFTCLGLFGIAPMVHQWAVHNHITLFQEALIMDLLMGAMYLIGVAFYATRVPERWKPGSFDLAFHSHNIFHICVVLAAYIHYEASIIFITWREHDACPAT